jgi:glycosyltransferase involved in cell wall biosynthesis
MKIAHLSFSKSFGADEQQTVILLNELAKRGVEQKLFIRKGVGFSLLDSRIDVEEVSQPLCFNVLKLKGFDLVHSHSRDGNRVATVRNFLFKTPFVSTADSDGKCVSRAVESFKSQAEFTSYDTYRRKEKMILNLQKSFPNRKYVGFIGDFSESGSEKTFIEAVRLISENHPQLYFIMLGGDGDEKLKCEEYAGNLPNISLLGEISDPKQYTEQFNLLVSGSTKGLNIVNSMKLSVPIIAEKNGVSELFIEDGKDGILFESKNSQKLGEKIIDLLRSSELQKRLVSGGLRKADSFSPKLLADRFEAVYEKIVIG